MSLFKSNILSLRFVPVLCLVVLSVGLAGCQFQPLYGDRSSASINGNSLSGVGVSQVNSRVGQQVRNHLLFLLNGGLGSGQQTHEARIRVTWNKRLQASIQGIRDNTSGTVTVTVSYDLVELTEGKIIASGKRQAEAAYDRTGQVFANNRAERDAENRAAKEAAESLRLAIASDLNRT